jgi:Bacterial TniB protein
MVIWGLVRSRLSIRRVLFLHLDEAQDLLRHQSAKELESVVRTLKVALILSGMPELKDLLNHDPQLARRFFPVEFPRLHRSGDIDRVIGMVKFYAEKADLGSLNVNTKDFAARLIHAADCEFGLSIELVIAAIEEALLADSASLSNMHFAEAFKIRSGCIAGLNPFLADSFERIDARALLDMGSHS